MAAWRSSLHRWRRWLVALGVLLVLRAALPEVVRRVVRSQVSQRLQTRVEIGDVDLALHRGGVALEDVALYAPAPAAPDEPPLVAWKRFAVELRYLPLFRKTVQLRRVELDAPQVILDRLANGELNLAHLVPASEPAPEGPAPAPAQEGGGWKTGIDSFALHAGGVRFRDLTLPEGEPLEIAIPDVDVGKVALQPGLYGEPGRARLYVKTEGGALRIDSRIRVLDKGFALATRLKAFHLPLRRARLYVPGIGWSELDGELDAAIDHRIAPGGENALNGMVRLRNVQIEVPDLPHAAFAVARLAVNVDPVDLGAQRVRVTRVDVGGASVVVDLQGGADVLPLLRRGGTSSPPAASPPEQPAADGAGAAAVPWHWAVDALDVADSKVGLLQEGEPLDVGITVTARALADEGDPGRLRATLAVAPGSLTIDGAVRPAPPGFAGTVRVERLPVHDLVRAAGAAARLPPGLLKAATLGADLRLAAGLPADGASAVRADALGVNGTIALEGVRVEGPDPGTFAVGWKLLVVPVDALELPGVLPGAAGGVPAPLRAAFGAIRLEEPAVQMTRTADGFVLPPPLGRPAGASSEAQPAAAPAPEPAPAPGPTPQVTIASFALTRGRLGLADQTVTPFFAGEIKPLDVDARGIRSEGPVVERFTLSAATPQKGKIDVSGTFRPEGGKVRVNGDSVALTPYNPFVTAFSNYSLGRGSGLSVRTDVTFGKGKYDAKTAITLQRLTVKGAAGDTLFKQQFGIPLSLALALLRDPSGNIKLDIPVAVDEAGTKVGLGTVMAGALRSAILGAVTSPLKGLGMAFGGAGQELALEPPPIATEVGRAVLTADGEKQAGQLAAFLAGRPGVGVELDAVVTEADARWLREQDLRAELEARTGMVNALRGLPERNARRRILAALAARAEGKPAELEGEDAKRLDEWLAERPALPPERLRALAAERAAAVAGDLRDRHGIQRDRVTTTEAKGEPREGMPAVLIAFTAAGE